MKRALVVLLLNIANFSSAGLIKGLLDTRTFEYPRFIKFPDGDGNLHDVDLEAEPNMELIEEITMNPDDNLYLLYTRQNQQVPQTLTMNNVTSITSSYFNAKLPTIVIVHGYLGNQYHKINPTLTDAVLDKTDANVIVMDWGSLALADYVTAVLGVPIIGQALGEFMMFLNSVTGVLFSSMHLVGLNMGAHLVGIAGRTMGGKVARITGLDPAGPLWVLNSNRLSPTDGEYVEAIHTDGGYKSGGLGIGTALAKVDFFPNGGVSQPDCESNICNQERAWRLFSSSIISNKFIGRKCNNTQEITENNCQGSFLAMGNMDLNKSGSGMYRLDTDST